jgi:hypothetical protein
MILQLWLLFMFLFLSCHILAAMSKRYWSWWSEDRFFYQFFLLQSLGGAGLMLYFLLQ